MILTIGGILIGVGIGALIPQVVAWWKARRIRPRALLRVYGTNGTYQIFTITDGDDITVSDAFTIKFNGVEILT